MIAEMATNIMILKQSCYRCRKILTSSWSQKHKISKILKISKVFKTLKIIKNINRYSSPPVDHIELAAETDSNSSVGIASHLSKKLLRDNQHICMGQFPQDRENGQNVAFLNFFGALLL